VLLTQLSKRWPDTVEVVEVVEAEEAEASAVDEEVEVVVDSGVVPMLWVVAVEATLADGKPVPY
jgi:hypothetical protein